MHIVCVCVSVCRVDSFIMIIFEEKLFLSGCFAFFWLSGQSWPEWVAWSFYGNIGGEVELSQIKKRYGICSLGQKWPIESIIWWLIPSRRYLRKWQRVNDMLVAQPPLIKENGWASIFCISPSLTHSFTHTHTHTPLRSWLALVALPPCCQ